MERMSRPSTRGFRGAAIIALCAGALVLGACSKPTPQETLTEAMGLLEEGQTARGILKLKEMTREHPDDPATKQARLFLARYYAREGSGTRAVEELEAVFAGGDASDPLVLEAGQGLVSLRAQLKDFEKAMETQEALMNALPADATDERESRLIDKAMLLLVWGEDEPAKAEEGLALLEDRMLNAEQPHVRGTAREQLANHWRVRGELEKCNGVYERYIAKYPEDTVRPRLELAMAVNLKAMEKTEAADALYKPAIDSLQKEADGELEKDKRAAVLDELASMAEAYRDLETADATRRRIMGENTMSQLAIQNQFRIAQMWAVAGIDAKDAALFEKGIAEFTKIAEDNKGTNIGETAAQAIGNARKVFDEAMNPPAEEPAAVQDGDAATSAPEAAVAPEATPAE